MYLSFWQNILSHSKLVSLRFHPLFYCYKSFDITSLYVVKILHYWLCTLSSGSRAASLHDKYVLTFFWLRLNDGFPSDFFRIWRSTSCCCYFLICQDTDYTSTSDDWLTPMPDLKGVDDCLNYDLNRVYPWLSAYTFIASLTKSEFMLIASRQRLSTICEIPYFTINDQPVSLGSIHDGYVLIKNELDLICRLQSVS